MGHISKDGSLFGFLLMDNELMAVYVYGEKRFEVYGCWDKDTPEQTYDFYDVYYQGECLNLGEPYYEFPTRQEILDLASMNDIV